MLVVQQAPVDRREQVLEAGRDAGTEHGDDNALLDDGYSLFSRALDHRTGVADELLEVDTMHRRLLAGCFRDRNVGQEAVR